MPNENEQGAIERQEQKPDLAADVARGLADYLEPVAHEPLPQRMTALLAMLDPAASRSSRAA